MRAGPEEQDWTQHSEGSVALQIFPGNAERKDNFQALFSLLYAMEKTIHFFLNTTEKASLVSCFLASEACIAS